MDAGGRERTPAAVAAAFDVVIGLFLVGAILLARRNMRLARGDRRGAFRLGLYVFSTFLVVETFRAGDLRLLLGLLPRATAVGVVFWLTYLALEPHVRRVWPETMLGWSRLIAGSLHDPLVGRDLLVGAVAGIVVTLLYSLGQLAPAWLGLPPPLPPTQVQFFSEWLLGGRHAICQVIGPSWGNAVFLALEYLLVLFFLYVVLRRRGIAAAAMILLLTALRIAFMPSSTGSLIVVLVFGGLIATGSVFLLVRFGMLAMIAAGFVANLTGFIPITFDSAVPYAGSSYLILGTILVLAAYGFHTALAGRPIFGAGFLKDEPAKPT